MTHRALDQAEVQNRLWNEVEKHQIGMLGMCGDAHHFQPMTAFVERETDEIWFFTYRDTDLAQAAGGGAPASFIFQTREVQACVDGVLTAVEDRARMDKYWNAHVAAWYPEGKDDPRLTMLRLECREAGVWLSEAGPFKYAWEVVRANATRTTPDVGERRDVNFH